MNKKEKDSIDRILEDNTYINLPLPNTEKLEHKALSYQLYLDTIDAAEEKPNKEYFNEFKQELNYYQHVKEKYDELTYVIDNEIDLITVNGEDRIPPYLKITEEDKDLIAIIIMVLKEIIDECERK